MTIIMDRTLKKVSLRMIRRDSKLFQKRYLEIIKRMKKQVREVVEHFETMIDQISTRISPPLFPRTPKILHKKIPFESETISEDTIAVKSIRAEDETIKSRQPRQNEQENDATPLLKSKRAASQKATETIKKQLFQKLKTKMRRPSSSEDPVRSVRSKGTKSSSNKTLETDMTIKGLSKIRKKQSSKPVFQKTNDQQISQPSTPKKPKNHYESLKKLSNSPLRSECPLSIRRFDVIDETILETNDDDDDNVTPTEPTIYHHPVDKVNSTTTITDCKMFNAMIVLERINETRSLSHKNPIQSTNSSGDSSVEQEKTIKRRNESSQLSVNNNNTLKRKLFDDVDDDDDEVVPPTPLLQLSNTRSKKFKQPDKVAIFKELFSSYSKESSVKKKVNPVEELGEFSVDYDTPVRVTRSMKAVQGFDSNVQSPVKLEKRLSRKSITKGRKNWEKNEDKENVTSPGQRQSVRFHQEFNDKLMTTRKKGITATVKKLPLTASKVHNISSSTESSRISRLSSKLGSNGFLSGKKKAVVDKEDARLRKEKAMEEQSREKQRKRGEKKLRIQRSREAKTRLEAEKKRKSHREKEERRKCKEQMKQKRLQKQKKIERKLVDHKGLKKDLNAKNKVDKQQKQLKNNSNNCTSDSDSNNSDSDNSVTKEKAEYNPIPQWAHSIVIRSHMEVQKNIPNEIVFAFFGTDSWSPNIADLFVGREKNRLVRTSSANWKRRSTSLDDSSSENTL